MTDNIIKYGDLLNTLNNNVKKSINNKTTLETLKKQLNEVTYLSGKIQLLLPESVLDNIVFEKLVKTIEISKEVSKILVGKIKLAKMTTETTTPFDIRVATALVQPYNGLPDGLESFVDSAKLLKDIIPPAQEATAVKFLKTRLLGKARLGLNSQINTIQALLDDLISRCTDTVTPEEVMAKLKAIKRTSNVQTLCEEVENLTMKLKNIYVNKKIPEEVAQSMVTKAGVDALISSVNQAETKLILKASNFKNVREAIQKINENQTASEPSMILSYNNKRVFHNSFRGRQNRFNTNSHQQSNTFHRPQQHNYYRGNNRPRFQNRGGRNQNFNMNRQPSFYRPNGGRGGSNGNSVYAVNSTPLTPAWMNHPTQQGYQPLAYRNATPQTAAPRVQQQQNDNFLGQVYGSQEHPNLPQF